MSLLWTDPPRPKQSVRGLCVRKQWEATTTRTPEDDPPLWLAWLGLAVLAIFGSAAVWVALRAVDVAVRVWGQAG